MPIELGGSYFLKSPIIILLTFSVIYIVTLIFILTFNVLTFINPWQVFIRLFGF